ncbi:hypothetical protein KJ599_02345, partial [bacterium]|nr:hypothetical protein [bacterium]
SFHLSPGKDHLFSSLYNFLLLAFVEAGTTKIPALNIFAVIFCGAESSINAHRCRTCKLLG